MRETPDPQSRLRDVSTNFIRSSTNDDGKKLDEDLERAEAEAEARAKVIEQMAQKLRAKWRGESEE